MQILKLIHYKDLLCIALIQYAIKYGVLLSFEISHGVYTTLGHFHFFILVFVTLCIAASGFIITAIYNVDSDKINKPEHRIVTKTISETTCFNLFMLFTIVGVSAGFYLAFTIDKATYFTLFFIASALLYIYASGLKQMVLIGNIVIGIVLAMAIISIPAFELLPALNANNKSVQLLFFNIIRDYSVFAFLSAVLISLVNDLWAFEGDFKTELQTLPVVFGKKRATQIAFILGLCLVFIVLFYLITYLYTQPLILIYGLTLVVGPLIYACIKLFNAKEKKHYASIFNVLKFSLITGLFSMALYKFVIL